MGILDDAIREHLELKRQHGAAGDDLRKIEQDAFGPADEEGSDAPLISDAEADAPTQFMNQEAVQADPQAAVAEAPPVETAPESSQAPEASTPPPVAAPPAAETPAVPATETPAPAPEPDTPDPGESSPAAPEGPTAPPPEPEQDAAEHVIPPQPAPTEISGEIPERRGPDTEERHAIAEQPTELFDVAAELDEEERAAADVAPAEAPPAPPTAEEPAPEAVQEEPVPEPEEPVDLGAEAELAIGDDEDFFNEQTLSDELDQALDSAGAQPPAPAAEPLPEPESYQPLPPEDDETGYEEPAIESEEVYEEPEPQPETDESAFFDQSAQPDTEVAPLPEPSLEPERESEPEAAPPPPTPAPDDEEEDVLEDTPDFLQDTPEHDRLWFEQKPPKDFDFDD